MPGSAGMTMRLATSRSQTPLAQSREAAMTANRNGSLTIAERLACADRLRKAGPALEHLDVPAMIREDRERGS